MAVDGTYSFDPATEKDSRSRRRRIAEQLMMQGMETSPIQSPWQGAARMAQALMGGIELGMEDKKEREQLAASSAHNSSIAKDIFGGGGGEAGGSPVTTALAGKPMGGPIKLGGFDASVGRTLQFEGGLNPNDSHGSPSNFGINQKANPDVDVTKLTPQGATEIYRKRYWDAIGADKMDPRTAHVAFDTAVIAGPKKAKELLAASGGDPEKFLALREAFQSRLLAADPKRFGPYAEAWGKRTATLRADVGVGGGGQPGGMMAVGGGGGQTTMAGGDTLEGGNPTARIQQLYAKAVHPMTSPGNKTLLMAEIKRLQDASDPDKVQQRRLTDLQMRKAERELGRPDVSGVEIMRDPTTGEIVRVDKATGQATVVRQGQASNKAPETRVVKQPDGSEVALQWDTGSKKWLPMDAPQGGNPVAAPLKLTEAQSKDQAFLTRSNKLIPRLEKQDEALLDGLSATGGRIPLVGNYLKTPEYRNAEQTARELLAVILRKDTGAAVTDQEMSQYSWIYLPQPGDDKETIIQKREGRRTAIDGLRRGLGGLDIILDQRDALLERQSAAKPAPGASVPAPTAKGAPKGPPAGVSPAEWKAMTDEERALWK
jgi:hypothetical protein